MAHQVRKPEANIRTNAAALVPVRPAKAERIHLVDGNRGGGGGHMTGNRNMAALLALSGVDLNTTSTEEIVQHNTGAPREIEENNMAAPEETRALSTASPHLGSFYFFFPCFLGFLTFVDMSDTQW